MWTNEEIKAKFKKKTTKKNFILGITLDEELWCWKMQAVQSLLDGQRVLFHKQLSLKCVILPFCFPVWFPSQIFLFVHFSITDLSL